MKAALTASTILLLAGVLQAADPPPLEVLRPNASDRLQPGTSFTVQWRVPETAQIGPGDWNLFLDTNNVQVGRLIATAVDDGGGNWHADITIPNEVRPRTIFDDTWVELPSGCNYTLHIHEDGTEADGRSDVFCLGVPHVALRLPPLEICWTSRSNRVYQVQCCSALTSNGWADLGPPIAGNGSTNCVTDHVTPDEQHKFYRVKEVP